MSSILGLTTTDFRDCFTNDLDAVQVCFAGAAVGGGVTLLALKLINRDQASLKSIAVSSGIGTAAGFCSGAYIASHAAPIAATSDTALKFLALTSVSAVVGSLPAREGAVIGLLTFGGGVWPAFGRAPLYYAGLFASIYGASRVVAAHS